ncbi:T-cell surface antigen CD2 [Willisornis vidua]|uniref:T-cell surface antigen CD2 n=1 Tax=Willisornis vidua TaxID=1566151 RepID=A0ABQ9D203_9PASS|nr:T-cell surface antigen CD2 [Willisornis vidua]
MANDNLLGSVVNWVYKAVNETAFLSIAAPGHIYEAKWMKDGKRLGMIKNNEVKYYVNKDECRCAILQNGTLQIRQVVKGDTGNYTVTVHEKDGKFKAEEATLFFVQDPVPQPILSGECVNKTAFVKCEVNQKAKDQEFIIELIQPNERKIQNNTTMLELQTRHSGTFKCVVKNQASLKMAEKVIKCSGKLDLRLILIIAGGAGFFVIFGIWLTCCIRRKKTNQCEDDDEERMMQALPPEREKAVREKAVREKAVREKAMNLPRRNAKLNLVLTLSPNNVEPLSPKNIRDPAEEAFPKAVAEQHDMAAAPLDLLVELGREKKLDIFVSEYQMLHTVDLSVNVGNITSGKLDFPDIRKPPNCNSEEPQPMVSTMVATEVQWCQLMTVN